MVDRRDLRISSVIMVKDSVGKKKVKGERR
jgi:hypothetical protein